MVEDKTLLEAVQGLLKEEFPARTLVDTGSGTLLSDLTGFKVQKISTTILVSDENSNSIVRVVFGEQVVVTLFKPGIAPVDVTVRIFAKSEYSSAYTRGETCEVRFSLHKPEAEISNRRSWARVKDDHYNELLDKASDQILSAVKALLSL